MTLGKACNIYEPPSAHFSSGNNIEFLKLLKDSKLICLRKRVLLLSYSINQNHFELIINCLTDTLPLLLVEKQILILSVSLYPSFVFFINMFTITAHVSSQQIYVSMQSLRKWHGLHRGAFTEHPSKWVVQFYITSYQCPFQRRSPSKLSPQT